MKRLHPDTLGELSADVALPAYDRDQLGVGIVHLGVGAFHRAHQAVFTEDAIEQRGGDWGIVGVSLRSSKVAQQLNPQGGLFSVMSEDAGGAALRVVGAVREVLVAPDDPAAVVNAIADQAVKIVTLTITEKGYTVGPDGVSLDRGNEAVQGDLADPDTPTTAVGLLALALRQRVAAGGAPLTLLSCDNLSENSRLLRGVLRDYLKQVFPDVIDWLDACVSFPCSMVDRIVPAVTNTQRQRQADLLGVVDEGAVCTEPFIQWIIEDRFAAERPAWGDAGAQIVDDILPFENIKLRLLNASHSAIAYCGLLAGRETVDEVMADAHLSEYVERLMNEALLPSLEAPAGFSLEEYRDALLARFSNPCLGHRCAQIAMDGSEKITQRWLPTLQLGRSAVLEKALSAWCYFILFTDLPIDDPRTDLLLAQRDSDESLANRASAVLACARITAQSVPDFDDLLAQVSRNLNIIEAQGINELLTAR